jgi:predicted dehydrogenase
LSDRLLRWGIVGTGGIASTFAKDMALSETGEVVAIGSRQMNTAADFAKRHAIPTWHGSYAELANDPDVDVVYVATLNPFHHSNALLALRAGKPVLVEKPFCMSAIEAREVIAEARRARLFLMEAMWTRFLPHIVEIRRLIATGVLGEIVTVVAEHGHWFPRDENSRAFATELGGGALLDLGVYLVSFASMILGTPDHVSSIVEPAFSGVDGQTSMLFGYRSGAHAVLTCTTSAMGPVWASIVGTEGRIDVDGPFLIPTSFTLQIRGRDPVRVELPHEGRGLRHQTDEVARCLADGALESAVMPLDETISIMETMDTVLAQGVWRRSVPVAEDAISA